MIQPDVIQPEVYQAGGTELILLAIAGGALLASRIFAPKTDENQPIKDNKPTTLSLKGESYVPIVIGRRRIGPVFAWAGERKTKSEGGGGGGKGGGGGGSSKKYIYYEKGWHVLAVGPGSYINNIYRDGRTIADAADAIQNINYGGGVSTGDTITLNKKEGSFTIYWGEQNQAINTFLGDSERLGISSRWPHMFYVVWGEPSSDGKRMSTSPVWPIVDYDITIPIPAAWRLTGSPWWFASAGAGGDPLHEGVNPAHALWSLLRRPYPHGLDIDAARLDVDSFENAGLRLYNEGLHFNIFAKDGISATQLTAQFLQEMGYVLTQVGDRVVLIPVRKTTVGVPDLTDDVVAGAAPREEKSVDLRRADRVTYEFDDIEWKFRRGEVQIDSESGLRDGNRPKPKRRKLFLVTSKYPADVVGRRLYIADTIPVRTISLKVLRDAKYLFPGQLFTYGGVQYRLAERTYPMSGSSTLKATLDLYSLDEVDYLPDPPAPPPDEEEPAADVAFWPVELPPDITLGSQVEVIVPRIRANDATIGGEVNLGDDDPPTSYVSLGSQAVPCGGGSLLEDFPRDSGGYVEYGPKFQAPADQDDTLNYAGTISETLWLSGHRVAVINGELILFRYVQALGNNQWQIRGMLRGFYDTLPEYHNEGSYVFLFNQPDMTRFTHTLLVDEFTSHWKVVPDTIDIADVTASQLDITERKDRPRPIDNLEATGDDGAGSTVHDNGRTLDRINKYRSGDDIVLDWDYRNASGSGKAAGEQGYDDAWSDDAPGSEGTFVFRMYEDPPGSQKGSDVTASADARTVTISNATLQAAFSSSEPASFVIRGRSVVSTEESLPFEIQIEKVT